MLRPFLIAVLLSLPVWAAPPAEPSPSRADLYQALLSAKVLNPDRELVHLSLACSLRLDNALYPVVDIQELVKGATTPRGVNHIVVLSPALKPAKQIEYTSQRPLFCQDNRLYVFGDLMIGNTMPEGNVLTFTNGGRTVTLQHVEANDYPVPPTRSRRQPPQ